VVTSTRGEFEPAERDLLQAPLGRLPADAIASESWRLEGLGVLAWALSRLDRGPHERGALYRLFLVSYLAWRVVIDFMKPEPAFAGLSAIQWACVAALIFYARDTARMFSARGRLASNG